MAASSVQYPPRIILVLRSLAYPMIDLFSVQIEIPSMSGVWRVCANRSLLPNRLILVLLVRV